MRRVLCVSASALVLAPMTSAVFAQDAEVMADTAPAVAEAEYELPTIVVGTDASKNTKKQTSRPPQAQSSGSPSSTATASQKQNPSGTASSGSVAGGGAETDQTADVDGSADGSGASSDGAAGDAAGSTRLELVDKRRHGVDERRIVGPQYILQFDVLDIAIIDVTCNLRHFGR